MQFNPETKGSLTGVAASHSCRRRIEHLHTDPLGGHRIGFNRKFFDSEAVAALFKATCKNESRPLPDYGLSGSYDPREPRRGQKSASRRSPFA